MTGQRTTAAVSAVLTLAFGVLGMIGDPLWLIGALAEAAITAWLIADLTVNQSSSRIRLHPKETHL